MDIWHSVTGMVKIEIVSADLIGLLSALQKENIAVYQWSAADDLTAVFSIRRGHLKRVKFIAEGRGEHLRVQGRSGLYWVLKQLSKRKALIIGLTLILALQIFVSSRVLFIEIEGNGDIPAAMILECAEKCGIRFGASRSEVRSERMKNTLLSAMPDLQWAGINTAGCTAVISVRVRNQQVLPEKENGVNCMIAIRDGVILSCTATSGNLLCTPGQEVKAGDKLISGYTDCGLSIRANSASGEVFAKTQRNISVITPAEFQQKGEIKAVVRNFSLIIGKKQINFCKDSGISDTSCDKMYVQKYLTLPGGFVLPISVVTETVIYYETSALTMAAELLQAQGIAFAQEYLLSQMIAGEILEGSCEMASGDITQLSYQCTCTEMIGRIQKEEIIAPNG